MSDMSFSTAYQEVAGQLGLDYADANTLTRLKRWLNTAYKDIAGFYRWSWLKDREAVTMEVDYTTGTVSVAAAGTTLTFSSGPTASKANYFIQFSSADDWYKITAHTAGETSATISPAYAKTSALSSGTFTIRKYHYSLSSNCEYVESCKQAVSNEKVGIINARNYDKAGFPTDTGTVKKIVFWGTDSNNYWTFTPFPIPDAAMLLEFRTIKKITELSASTDTTIFPQRFDSVWLDIAKMYGYEFLNNDAMYRNMFNKVYNVNAAFPKGTLVKMKDHDMPGRGELPVLESVDQIQSSSDIVRFPDDYEAY